MTPPVEYEISEIFEVTGRGAVVVIDAATGRKIRVIHRSGILKPDGTSLMPEAEKEYLLRRQPVVVEKEAYMLKALRKSDIPAGSRLRFVE
jgi:hypothetical protein